MNETAKKTFHESIAKLLSVKLEKYSGKSLTKESCQEIYVTIFETLVELFTQVKAPIDNEAVNYVAQQYYDGIQIKHKDTLHELDPNVFEKRAKLEEIPTKELAFLTMLLDGTDFRFPILEEIKKRS